MTIRALCLEKLKQKCREITDCPLAKAGVLKIVNKLTSMSYYISG
jgi:hypothetical protein